ncbi:MULTISPECIES: MerR family transcriptional regulator [Actinoplanes]|uniref:MerR family transcriptional regulator n=1 Tax=Actinoplanes TaxID=1865 RepID=UPI0005F29B20|nr:MULTISPECIES: MerR family transcriptional regulator [Actinoplanes]GLY00474.1 transcriptional regulator [Actinoplanes sp. NBRC 101535]
MRISDLSRRSGVPVATIKFYLREHLLPPGERTGHNQAVYGDAHLHRLQLIRVFTTIGQLDLTSVRRLLATVEDDRLPLTGIYDILNQVLAPAAEPVAGESPALAEALADVDRLVRAEGWQVRPDAATRAHLATVLSAMRRLAGDWTPDSLDEYVKAADRLVRREVDELPPDPSDRAAAVAHSLLLGEAYAAIRRLAQEHHVSRRFGEGRAL